MAGTLTYPSEVNPADTTVLDLWMATEDQFVSGTWSDSEPLENLARWLFDDTGGLDVLWEPRQIDRARSFIGDYVKFPFEEDSHLKCIHHIKKHIKAKVMRSDN